MEADLVNAALETRNGRWFGGLASVLVRTRWSAQEASTGITRATYGTGRYLARDVTAQRNDLTRVSLPDAFWPNTSVLVESLNGQFLRQYAELGLNFYNPKEIDAGLVRDRLHGALRRLSDVSDVAAAVGAVLAVVHVLKPHGPAYDVSYSDPFVPFSIFVGISVGDQAHSDLRLAEGILHECMHLQLTLIEQAVPMIAGAEERHHSPWQGTLRPSQGILHGLYVFRVIQDFCCALLDQKCCTADERSYLTSRINMIDNEVATIGDFSSSKDLTDAGKRLVRALLGS